MTGIQKGVMLCERPANSTSTGGDISAFIPSSAPSSLDPLGLVPIRKEYEVVKVGPSVTDRHRTWVRQYGAEIKEAKEKQMSKQVSERQKREELSKFTAKLRSTILKGESVTEFWDAASTVGSAGKNRQSSERSTAAGKAGPGGGSSALMQDVDDFVNSLFEEAGDGHAHASAPETSAAPAAASPSTPDTYPADADLGAAVHPPVSRSASARPGSAGGAGDGLGAKPSKGKKKKSKPAWALTEDDVDALEEDEAEDLLAFVDGLDFDSFMAQLDDPELEQTFKKLEETDPSMELDGADDKEWRKNMVKAMNHVAMRKMMATKVARVGDEDAQTEGAASEAPSCASRTTAAARSKADAASAKLASLAAQSAANRVGGFDASSMAADDVARMERLATKMREAEELLRENPDLKSVHSLASVRAMLTKTEGGLSD